MMWTRFELKERGKAAFQRNYWRSVLVAFILMLFVSGGGSAVSNSWNQITSSGTSDDSYYTEYFDDGDIGHFYYNSGTSIPGMLVSGIIAVVVGGVMIVSALLGIFLFNPLEVGGCRFFMENSEYQPTVGRLGFAFQKGMYGKTVLTLFLRKLFIGLWSLLLIVPGIVKAYEYRMVPYLLADDPNKADQDLRDVLVHGLIGPSDRAEIAKLLSSGKGNGEIAHWLSAAYPNIIETMELETGDTADYRTMAEGIELEVLDADEKRLAMLFFRWDEIAPILRGMHQQSLDGIAQEEPEAPTEPPAQFRAEAETVYPGEKNGLPYDLSLIHI